MEKINNNYELNKQNLDLSNPHVFWRNSLRVL